MLLFPSLSFSGSLPYELNSMEEKDSHSVLCSDPSSSSSRALHDLLPVLLAASHASFFSSVVH